MIAFSIFYPVASGNSTKESLLAEDGMWQTYRNIQLEDSLDTSKKKMVYYLKVSHILTKITCIVMPLSVQRNVLFLLLQRTGKSQTLDCHYIFYMFPIGLHLHVLSFSSFFESDSPAAMCQVGSSINSLLCHCVLENNFDDWVYFSAIRRSIFSGIHFNFAAIIRWLWCSLFCFS